MILALTTPEFVALCITAVCLAMFGIIAIFGNPD